VRREDAVDGYAGRGPQRNRSHRTSSVLAAPTAGWQSYRGPAGSEKPRTVMRHGGVSDLGMRPGAVVEPSQCTPSELAVPTAGRQSPPGEFRWVMRRGGAWGTGMRQWAVVEPCRGTSSGSRADG
jgi:hypothetical protein